MVIKPDVRITDTMTASMTYTRDRPTRLIPRASAVNFRTFAGETDRYTGNFTIAHARWTSETRYGYNRNHVDRLDGFYNVQDPDKPESSPGGRRVAGISALGFGNDGEINTLGAPGQSIEEKIAITAGQHSLKFGGSSSAKVSAGSISSRRTFATKQRPIFWPTSPAGCRTHLG